MTDCYLRNCVFCGSTIRMAKMHDGQWLPFEVDGSGKHQCAPHQRLATVLTLSRRPTQTGCSPSSDGCFPEDDDALPSTTPRYTGCLCMALVLMTSFKFLYHLL